MIQTANVKVKPKREYCCMSCAATVVTARRKIPIDWISHGYTMRFYRIEPDDCVQCGKSHHIRYEYDSSVWNDPGRYMSLA